VKAAAPGCDLFDDESLVDGTKRHLAQERSNRHGRATDWACSHGGEKRRREKHLGIQRNMNDFRLAELRAFEEAEARRSAWKDFSSQPPGSRRLVRSSACHQPGPMGHPVSATREKRQVVINDSIALRRCVT